MIINHIMNGEIDRKGTRESTRLAEEYPDTNSQDMPFSASKKIV